MTADSLTSKFILLILLVFLLHACGFQLRGQADLPSALAVTYIDVNQSANVPPSELAQALKRALVSNGNMVVDDPQTATATLKILGESQARRTIATGPQGDVREYELNYVVAYNVTLADGSILMPKDTIRITRDVLYAESQVLGREAGEEIIKRDMISDAAFSIIRRLQAIRQSS